MWDQNPDMKTKDCMGLVGQETRLRNKPVSAACVSQVSETNWYPFHLSVHKLELTLTQAKLKEMARGGLLVLKA